MASNKDFTARTMGLCHTLVSTFSQSWLKRRDLAKAQVELQIPQHGLILSSVTVSSVKPFLKILTEDVLKPSDEDTALTSNIKRKMCSGFKDKYESAALQDLLAKACLLDPRYRGKSHR
ncbi:hypothetical protein N1851_027366 [Merluccius polli]|uniref:Uncharacterized protein n=1 Tax=Merluccius polli TaxID=89951 RepID=A0AA47NUC9_MERPO|nr:hypothetical protein N1851_027366 [Merluccius polli]